jgi:hypothetical protein
LAEKDPLLELAQRDGLAGSRNLYEHVVPLQRDTGLSAQRGVHSPDQVSVRTQERPPGSHGVGHVVAAC